MKRLPLKFSNSVLNSSLVVILLNLIYNQSWYRIRKTDVVILGLIILKLLGIDAINVSISSSAILISTTLIGVVHLLKLLTNLAAEPQIR